MTDKVETLEIALTKHFVDGDRNGIGQIEAARVGYHRDTHGVVVVVLQICLIPKDCLPIIKIYISNIVYTIFYVSIKYAERSQKKKNITIWSILY